jgi:hypothetical protein
MTDFEFDILDELYFVKSLHELNSLFNTHTIDISVELWAMIEKGWVKVMDKADNELPITKEEYFQNCHSLWFNISKKGLMAHNQI